MNPTCERTCVLINRILLCKVATSHIYSHTSCTSCTLRHFHLKLTQATEEKRDLEKEVNDTVEFAMIYVEQTNSLEEEVCMDVRIPTGYFRVRRDVYVLTLPMHSTCIQHLEGVPSENNVLVEICVNV